MLHQAAFRLLPALVLLIAFGLASAAAPNQNQRNQQNQARLQQMIRQLQQQQQQQQRMIQVAQQQARTQQQRTAQVARRQNQQNARNNRNQPRPVLKNVVAEYEFTLADDALVRTMTPASTEIDDKGRPKKLDAEEKKKLKGETPEERKLIGYKAAVEDLQVGDEIVITLSRYRPLNRGASPGEAKAKDGARKKDAETKEKTEKDKDEKAKDKDQEAEVDENDDAHKLAHLKDWKPYTKLHGTIVESDLSGSRRLTIAIQGQQVVMQQPNNNRNGQPNNNNNNAPANAKPTHTAIDPSTLQGTFVIVVKRGENLGSFIGTTKK